MALSLKQAIANRLNALKSTGPRTFEGKARSSQNARTHGLSRIGHRPPAEMAEAIAERLITWRPDHRPEGEAQQWAFERLCAESVRLDFCDARILAARAERSRRALESWDDDRAAEVAQLAARLPRDPGRVQPLLLQSKHGVLWLLERWAEVAESLARHRRWDRDSWSLALDLLGLPASARDDSNPWDLDPEDPEDPSAVPGLDLVTDSISALRDRLDAYLDDRDERARFDAQLGLDGDDPPAIRLLERYASDARRRVSFFTHELRRLQSLHASSPPIPAAPPGPRPSRVRNEPIAAPSAAVRNEPIPAPPPARNEPIPAGTASTQAAPDRTENISPKQVPSSGGPPRVASFPSSAPRENRRARRARAAAARRS